MAAKLPTRTNATVSCAVVPGTTFRGTFAPPAVTGTHPTAGTSTKASGWGVFLPGSFSRGRFYLLPLYLFTSYALHSAASVEKRRGRVQGEALVATIINRRYRRCCRLYAAPSTACAGSAKPTYTCCPFDFILRPPVRTIAVLMYRPNAVDVSGGQPSTTLAAS